MNASFTLSYNWATKELTVENGSHSVAEDLLGSYTLLLDGEPAASGAFSAERLLPGERATFRFAFPKSVEPNVSPATWGERHLNVSVATSAGRVRRQFPADFKTGLFPPIPRIQQMASTQPSLILAREDGADSVTLVLDGRTENIRWFGILPGAEDGEVGIAETVCPADAGLREVRRLRFSGGSSLLKIAAKRGTFDVSLRGAHAEIKGIAPENLVFDEWNPEAELILTAPFQQNVGTDAFSICCETSREEPSLRLVVEGRGDFPFEFRRADFSGTYFAVARVTGCTPGETLKCDLSTGGFPGTVKLWKECEDDFKCAIWGDYQAALYNGPQVFDWEEDPFRAGEMMFRDMIRENCEFAVTTGDMADVGHYAKELRPLYLERTCGIIGRVMPFYVAFGNHDSIHPENHFFVENPSAGSFAFVKNNCLFLCIDDFEAGNDKLPASPELLRFVEETLSSEAAAKAKFVFAFQHVPIYVETFGNCNRNLLGLYEKYGVDCVFSGDHHGYEHIVRGKIRQIVNGCMGYFRHEDGYVNWFGDETKAGGHKDIAVSWRFQKPGCPGVLGEPEKVNLGLLPGYATLEVRGDTATFRLHGFNADGSKIGVVDTVEMVSGRRPEAMRGLAVEYFAWNLPEDPAWGLLFTLTGKGGRSVRLSDWGAMEVADNIRTFHDHYEAVKSTQVRWDAHPFHTDDTVGVRFVLKGDDGAEHVRLCTMLPDNTLEILDS